MDRIEKICLWTMIVCAVLIIIINLVTIAVNIDSAKTIGRIKKRTEPPINFPEWMIEHGYHWAECNRRIRDQEYTAGAWYRTEDPNVTVYLNLVEQEGWNMPVLHYSASDPNATIWIYQQLLANTSGAPIRWGGYHVVPRHGPYDFPKTDPNDYAKFMDKKIKFYDGVKEYDISREAPVTVR